MAVAKTYQNCDILCEPYAISGRKYVTVLYKGHEKQVRWYSDAEYAKMYGAPKDVSKDPYYKSQREILGFKNGYITIFKGNTYAVKDWFKENGATYRKWWGWSFGSDVAVPDKLPEGVEAIQLPWSAVAADHENLLPEDQVKAIVETYIYDTKDTEFLGKVGDKIDTYITVLKNVVSESYWGTSHIMTFEDEDGHILVWATSAKDWEVGDSYHIKGTIKDHKTYRGEKQTWLTRCRVVE